MILEVLSIMLKLANFIFKSYQMLKKPRPKHLPDNNLSNKNKAS